ncbi:MAG: DUF1349 domain-containing protein [Alphaproteobacteria bacterium]
MEGIKILHDFQWLNPPKEWKIKDNQLKVITDDATDFWRKTFYGFINNNGHFYYTEITGDFTCAVDLVADFEVLYDQLGLMICSNDEVWAKTGLEYTDGDAHISAVVTNDTSDWSVVRHKDYNGRLRIQLTRHGQAVRIQYLSPQNEWQMLRLAHLDLGETCQIGLMACSPQRAGFKAKFENFTLGEAIPKELHGD